jgi:small subunit ribosomal protein S6
MPTYETLFILPPNLTESDEQATVDGLEQIVTSGGGSMVANDRMGRRRLAYPIRKFEDGVYNRFLYDSESDVPRELERRIRISDNVLRSLTVLLEKDWAEASKEQARRDAERRAEAEREAAAEAARAAEAAAAAAAAAAEAGETGTAAPAVAETDEAAEAPAEPVAEPAAEEPAGEPAEESPTEEGDVKE